MGLGVAINEIKEGKKSTINLSFNSIGDEGAKVLFEALKHATKVKTIDLTENKIGSVGTQYLAECLAVNNSITTLNLSQNQINNEDALYFLFQNLIHNCTLKQLDLTGNRITDKGVEQIVVGLKKNRTLTELNLSMNQLRDKSVTHLSMILMTNTSLRSLDLYCNRINYSGIQLLTRCMKYNATLDHLSLSDNRLSDECIVELSKILKTNTTLTSLDLSCNDISDEGVESLSRNLKENRNITNLYLTRNNAITTKGLSLLLGTLRYNTTLTSIVFKNLENEDMDRIDQLLARNQSKIVKMYHQKACTLEEIFQLHNSNLTSLSRRLDVKRLIVETRLQNMVTQAKVKMVRCLVESWFRDNRFLPQDLLTRIAKQLCFKRDLAKFIPFFPSLYYCCESGTMKVRESLEHTL